MRLMRNLIVTLLLLATGFVAGAYVATSAPYGQPILEPPFARIANCN